jgi:hypothetical protein
MSRRWAFLLSMAYRPMWKLADRFEDLLAKKLRLFMHMEERRQIPVLLNMR